MILFTFSSHNLLIVLLIQVLMSIVPLFTPHFEKNLTLEWAFLLLSLNPKSEPFQIYQMILVSIRHTGLNFLFRKIITGHRKPCNCTKSMCLKLYCECFANGMLRLLYDDIWLYDCAWVSSISYSHTSGEFCRDCNCKDCHNNLAHESERTRAIKSSLERNPNAFKPKIGSFLSDLLRLTISFFSLSCDRVDGKRKGWSLWTIAHEGMSLQEEQLSEELLWMLWGYFKCSHCL